MQQNILTFYLVFSECKDKVCEVTGPDSETSLKEPERMSSQKDRSPQTIVPVKMNSLRVQAQRVHGHYQPLHWRLLEWNLNVHVETQEIQNEQDKITQVFRFFIWTLCLLQYQMKTMPIRMQIRHLELPLIKTIIVVMLISLYRVLLQRCSSCVRATLG